jgi:hypothetical protein
MAQNDNHIGSIKRLMIEKKTGQVAYTVMSFGGFLGSGEEEHTIPGASSIMTPASAGSAPTSQRSSFAGRRPSIAIATTTGRTGSASASCTTTGERHTTGVFERELVRLSWTVTGDGKSRL